MRSRRAAELPFREPSDADRLSQVSESQGHRSVAGVSGRETARGSDAAGTTEKTILFVSLNVFGLRSKASRVVGMVGCLEAQLGQTVVVLGLGTRPTGERQNRPPTKIAQASRWRPPEAVRGSKPRFRNR